MESLENELRALLNRVSRENVSNTPDFVLAQFILGCLAAFETATQQRETWYGRDASPSAPPGSTVVIFPRPAPEAE